VVLPPVGPAGGGPGDEGGSGERQARNGGRAGAPLLVAAAVAVALAVTVPFLVSAWKRQDAAADTATAATVATATPGRTQPPHTHEVSAMPSAVPSKKAPASAPHHQQAAATPPPAAPRTVVTHKPAAPATTEPSKALSAADADRARANAASSATAVEVKNLFTGLCADLPNYGDGTGDGPVQQHSCNGTSADNQLWDLQVTNGVQGPGGADLFVIRNHKDGLCMDLPGTGADPAGTEVQELGCLTTTADNQLWMLVPRPDGTYWISNYAGGSCLNVAGTGNAGKQDVRLAVGPCNDSSQDDYHWFLE
jgi:hypothetical protein